MTGQHRSAAVQRQTGLQANLHAEQHIAMPKLAKLQIQDPQVQAEAIPFRNVMNSVLAQLQQHGGADASSC
jgi:hypothetical protein